MRAVLSLVLLAVGWLIAGSGESFADKRVALVIGNSDYQHASRLPNPVNDAGAVSILLQSAGFEVVETRNDLTNREMRRIVNDFTDKTRGADIAVVFFAGHGIEVGGNNYLIPTDAALARDIDVEDEAISLERILKVIEPARRLRLVILDACRDNPFDKKMQRTILARSFGRGLARIEPTTTDTFIAFAAKHGSVAADGEGINSPFTTSLLKHMTVPGLDLRKVFGLVRDEVMTTTSNRQEPFTYGSLGGTDVSLVPPQAGRIGSREAAEPAAASVNQAWRDFERAAQINTKEIWDEFLKEYPTGLYANLARAQRVKLLTATTPTDTSAKAADAPAKPASTAVKVASVPAVQPAAEERTRTIVAREPKRPPPVVKKQRVKEKPKRTASRRGGDGGTISRNCGSIRSAVSWATSLGLDNGVGLVSRARRFCGG